MRLVYVQAGEIAARDAGGATANSPASQKITALRSQGIHSTDQFEGQKKAQTVSEDTND